VQTAKKCTTAAMKHDFVPVQTVEKRDDDSECPGFALSGNMGLLRCEQLTVARLKKVACCTALPMKLLKRCG
jgi:hypothetical protein